MRLFKVFLFIITLLFTNQFIYAQAKPVQKPVVTALPKMKPPKLQTFLDSYKDSVGISASEASRIIGLPLKIYDAKKNVYSVSSYQFLYKKKGVLEDEPKANADGQYDPKPTQQTTTISSDRFKVSPLPDLWVNLIREQIKPGEEFYFFDVIAKDAQGRVMYASSLKITIQ